MKCRLCGCTESDPCVKATCLGFETCGWAMPGLCEFCARRIRDGAESVAAFLGGAALIGFACFWLWASAP